MARSPKSKAPVAASRPPPPDIPAEPSARHRLAGLEPDNLLAFLALLGLLRALDAARPDWQARAFFDTERQPLRPVLTLAELRTPEEVAEAAGEGITGLAASHRFGSRKDLNYSVEEARAVQSGATPAEADVLSALMSDGAIKDKDDTIWPAPLCFLFGQGHQHFLDRLATVPARAVPPPRGRGRAATAVSATECLAEALFAPWRRLDKVEGLRWDPAEDRRYALRADDPSGDPAGLQHGANRLAAVGLPALSGTAIERRAETRFLTRATSYGPGGRILVTWPIWTRPARLAAIRALLAHPALARAEVDLADLRPLGVAGAMRAERVSVGKFFNITPARPIK